MQGKPRALLTTGITWLASLDPPQSGQLQNKKTTQACFHHRASSRAPLVFQAGRPALLTPSPLIFKAPLGVGDLGQALQGPRGGLPPGDGCADPVRAASGVGTKPLRNGPGWGFVSPRHLGHGFLRNKSKTFLLPGVPERRPLRALLEPG